MTLELTTLGVRCNQRCTYCYQNPMRDANNEGAKVYSIEKMKAAVLKVGSSFTMFGGEALLTPIADLEEFWRFGLEQYNLRAKKVKQKGVPNGLQTNGTLITDAHIALFKKYHVHVGFSMDGPGDLNNARWMGSLEKTTEGTKASQRNLEKLLKLRIGTSLILTLHRGNVGTPERLERVKEWLRDLDKRGLTSCRLHVLEVDHPTIEQIELRDEENVGLFVEFAQFEQELTVMRFDVFKDMENALRGNGEDLTCVWNPCDPLTTSAVTGVDGQGNLSNCGRTNKDGVNWLKAEKPNRERQFALFHTPQKYGGCLGCRFFLQCNGQCPGTSIDGDWRNKSKNCQVWMDLLELIEQRLIRDGVTPISMAPDRSDRERKYLQTLLTGGGQDREHGDHWDHTDAGQPHQDIWGGDKKDGKDGHGDEHGDVEHGDHTDEGRSMQLPVPQRVRRKVG